ncbi:ABA AND ROS SENSITIVE 1 [Hibiscus trionum]|uniref:ABA AND ROS SENSITIVE 1 n=1 Tax=Hibiscus trionum TaxID=183268 RepID=A0A9W7HIN9_HIBTR|nr:ABA AND ROS SENSITIVE 1 [Hibiscus trionum]
MDAQGRNKAVFRAKLNAQKKEKRIDNPLIKYNESDQPVCRVCDVVLKSISHWDAHQASRKHHEAINTLKANAAKRPQASNTQSGLPQGFFDSHGSGKQKTEIAKSPDPNSNKKLGISAQTHAKESLYSETEEDGSFQSSSIQTKVTQLADSRQVTQLETKKVKGSLPRDFFDKDETKLPMDVMKLPRENKQAAKQASAPETKTKQLKGSLPDDFFDKDDTKLPTNVMKPPMENKQASEQANALETKQVKGALPEGFFDNKEADLRARGIKPVKIDVKDEYKEFEKLIQEDLQEVDNRMEEEEIDAAETIEEAESLEQKVYKQKVEMLWKRKLQLESTRSNKRCKGKEADRQESDSEDSSSDGDSDENFAVDWRAQHL